MTPLTAPLLLASLVVLGHHGRSSARDVVVLHAEGPDRVLLRGGNFRMGSEAEQIAQAQFDCLEGPLRRECRADLFADEIMPHQVQLSDYWLDRTEVTVGAYQRCVDVGRCARLSHAGANAWTARRDHPMTLVSWYDARDYCQWNAGRLPTEAEWERAARGWNGRRYPWGEVFNPRVANHGRWALSPLDGSDGFLELAPVGSFPQGRTPEGIDDLGGNVEEWVADWYGGPYPEADEVDPKGPAAGDERIVRGGSFQHGSPWLRGAARGHDLPSNRRPWRGFRCAYDAN